jgi:hypothetical protein
MKIVGFRMPACSSIEGSKPRAGFLGGLMKVVIFSLAISASAAAGSPPANGHQIHNAISMAGGRFLAPRANMVASGSYYTGYRPGEVRGYRGPMEIAPQWRQNQADVAEDPANNAAKVRAQESEPQLKGANLSVTSQSLASAQGTVHKPISLPSGVKPQVTTPAQRSQATANINQKFQQAETKIANRPWDRPDRRNRLEQSRGYFIGLVDLGYPLPLLDTWCDDLLDDQVDVGMPIDLIDSYWGQPVSTQDYVEYYNPYEVCTYQTPDGNYRQVTFQNGVVTQAM